MNTNKFTSMLSASNADIKLTRAEELAEKTTIEVDAFITSLKRDKSNLKSNYPVTIRQRVKSETS